MFNRQVLQSKQHKVNEIKFQDFNNECLNVSIVHYYSRIEVCIRTHEMQPNEQFAVKSLQYPKPFELQKHYFCLIVFLFSPLLNKLQLLTS